MRRTIGLCGIVLLGSFAVQPLGAQRDTRLPVPRPGRIVGVFDDANGAPIVGAEVMDVSTDSVAHTEAHGLVELSHFRNHSDSVIVSIRKEGFADTTIIVLVGSADTVPVQVNLHREEVVLPTIVAVPLANGQMERHMRDYEARRRDGTVEYISRKTLSKYDKQSLSEALRLLRRGCDNLSLNGQPIANSRDNLQALGRFTSNVDGIELYRTFAPSIFSDNDHPHPECVMVVWTRIPPPGE